MADLPCFVINLAANPGRMKVVAAGLATAAIGFERIEAVDGRGRDAAQFPSYDRSLGRRLYGRRISGAEAACFLSHRSAAMRFLATGAEAGLVLEDDAVVPSDLAPCMVGLCEWLAAGFFARWDVVNLGRGSPGAFSPLPFAMPNRPDCRLGVCHAFPLTTTGLLWSRQGAAAFLEASQRIYAPVDQFLCDHFVSSSRGLGFVQAPIRSSGAPSDINYRLWRRIVDTRDLGALITRNRRLKRNARLAEAARLRFQALCPLSGT